MFKYIEGLPQNVMPIEATRQIAHEDYQMRIALPI